ncbi:MAG: hypothetical protein WA667_29630 [Candidatus Nitrosopolaris sp.]
MIAITLGLVDVVDGKNIIPGFDKTALAYGIDTLLDTYSTKTR